MDISCKVAAFVLNDGLWFVGYARESDSWNGFACPYFTKRESARILDYLKVDGFVESWSFDGDAFRVKLTGYSDDTYTEIFSSQMIDLKNGESRLAWSIGGWGWCWLWWDHFAPILA